MLDTSASRVWCFAGDGEMDEPEATAGLSMAARERLGNLTFVIDCNLQRLDGPVRGNGKIIQELEGIFRGAGWNVVKVLSMFGFQRVGDLIWAAADAGAKGFLLGCTAGRTTLPGEGLQHCDGHSPLVATTVPTLQSYGPAFAYKLAVIVQDGLRRMYVGKDLRLHHALQRIVFDAENDRQSSARHLPRHAPNQL